jgi:hypothetical protein
MSLLLIFSFRQLDRFLEPCSDLILLEAYMTNSTRLPDFVDIISEVTSDKAYSMWNIALPSQKRAYSLTPIIDLHKDFDK